MSISQYSFLFSCVQFKPPICPGILLPFCHFNSSDVSNRFLVIAYLLLLQGLLCAAQSSWVIKDATCYAIMFVSLFFHYLLHSYTRVFACVCMDVYGCVYAYAFVYVFFKQIVTLWGHYSYF